MSFIEKMKKGQDEFGGIPFWSWNDKLDPDELRRQIRVMKELGMKGFFMHARSGLETEYLSDEWYKCIEASIDEAKKLDMEAWSYDENGWPSGFAGGKCLENPWNFATYVVLEEQTEFPEFKENNPPEKRAIVCYIAENNTFKRVFEPVNNAEKYYVIYQGYDSAYVDTMDPKITDEFIKYTHEAYKERLGDDFGGKYMPGFFTDEPQYYRWLTPWSNTMPAEFEKAYGYSVYDKLIALFKDFDGADEFRYDYWYLAHRLFINNFQKRIYDWCHENNCKVTGHAIEETVLFGQMWCCGGIMPFYEYEDMPGMDYLCRFINSDLGPKQLGSVCAQLGKKKVLTETFACCGWDVTPKELKKIADVQYAGGVNVMCNHLYAYSERGQRKRDYPAHYSEHLPWQNALGDFMKYYARLGYILSEGEEKVNTLIIHPMHSEYLTYKKPLDQQSVMEVDTDIIRTVGKFSDYQIPYHLGDEEIMAKYARIDGDKFIVGNCTYDYVVLPTIYTLDGTTVKLLKEFLANGGKLLIENEKPTRIDGRIADMSWLENTCDFSDIEKASFVFVRNKLTKDNLNGVKAMTRKNEYGTLYYITNISENDYIDVAVTIPGAKSVKELMLEECDYTSGNGIKTCNCEATPDGICVLTSLESGKSHIYLADSEESIGDATACDIDGAYTINEEGIKLDGKFNVVASEDNALTLDYAMVSLDGGKTYQKPKPVIQIFDELLRSKFKGELFMKYIFDLKKMPEKLMVAVEPMKFTGFKVNCAPVEFTDGYWLDRSFKVADIKDYCAQGRNVIDMSFDYYQDDYVYYVLFGGVSESLRNCLVFNTEVESIYLFGDFGVSTENDKFNPNVRNSFEYTGKFAIVEKPDEIDASNIISEGYPFFAGKITLEKKFDGNGLKNPEIWIDGRFAYADVFVNDEFVKRLMFTNHTDISKFVKPGENSLKLTICNSNRNLLGPHHHADPEPYAVGPTTFSMEGMWHDGKCDAFTDRYSFVRFGTEVKIVNKV